MALAVGALPPPPPPPPPGSYAYVQSEVVEIFPSGVAPVQVAR